MNHKTGFRNYIKTRTNRRSEGYNWKVKVFSLKKRDGFCINFKKSLACTDLQHPAFS